MNKLLKQTCLVTSLMLSGSYALAADKVDFVNIAKGDGININDGKIFINPINGNYGQASTSTMTYHVKTKAGCNGQNVIKEFFVALGSENVSKNTLEASNNYHQTVPGQAYSGSLPWTEVAMKVPLNKLGFNPAEMCQTNLEQKMAKGASKMQVMSQDQVLTKGVWFTAVARCGKIGQSNDQYDSTYTGAELKIICKAGSAGAANQVQAQTPKPIPGPGAVQSTFHVAAVTFKPEQKELTTTCPAKVKFTGTIAASGKGDVKYRILLPNPATPIERTTSFDQAGSKPISPIEFTVNHSYPVASAALEVTEPNAKKVYANFKVTCIAAQGQGAIQQPGQNTPPGKKKGNVEYQFKVEEGKK